MNWRSPSSILFPLQTRILAVRGEAAASICVERQLAAMRASAHFPKFVIHRSTHFHELRKAMGTSKLIDSSAAFLFEVLGSNSPLAVQELQIGGTSQSTGCFVAMV